MQASTLDGGRKAGSLTHRVPHFRSTPIPGAAVLLWHFLVTAFNLPLRAADLIRSFDSGADGWVSNAAVPPTSINRRPELELPVRALFLAGCLLTLVHVRRELCLPKVSRSNSRVQIQYGAPRVSSAYDGNRRTGQTAFPAGEVEVLVQGEAKQVRRLDVFDGLI